MTIIELILGLPMNCFMVLSVEGAKENEQGLALMMDNDNN